MFLSLLYLLFNIFNGVIYRFNSKCGIMIILVSHWHLVILSGCEILKQLGFFLNIEAIQLPDKYVEKSQILY